MQSMDNLAAQVNLVKHELDVTDDAFIGIFLYGSQNYQLDYEESDTDSIIIVHSANMAKQELDSPTGKVKVYTLRYFLYRLKQGDLECYEILFTRYKILNPAYEALFAKFVSDFTHCMSYDRIRNSLYNKLNEHLGYVFWLMSNKDNARYSKKRLYWAIRVCNQWERINNGECFKSSLIYRDSLGYDLMKIKTITNYLSIKEVSAIYKYLTEFLSSQQRYSKDTSAEEEKCLSWLYENITELHNQKHKTL